MRRLVLVLVLSLAAPDVHLTAAQISKPVAHDSNVNTTGNKFLQRQASADEHILTREQ